MFNQENYKEEKLWHFKQLQEMTNKLKEKHPLPKELAKLPNYNSRESVDSVLTHYYYSLQNIGYFPFYIFSFIIIAFAYVYKMGLWVYGISILIILISWIIYGYPWREPFPDSWKIYKKAKKSFDQLSLYANYEEVIRLIQIKNFDFRNNNI